MAETQHIKVRRDVLSGVEMITRERDRQGSRERWSNSHDDTHHRGELAIVAAIYAVSGLDARVVKNPKPGVTEIAHDAWPRTWAKRWDKRGKHERLHELEIAGALIAAEIDRLQRIAVKDEEREQDERVENLTDTHPGIAEAHALLARALAGGPRNFKTIRSAAMQACEKLAPYTPAGRMVGV
jgi:hypothetical protein